MAGSQLPRCLKISCLMGQCSGHLLKNYLVVSEEDCFFCVCWWVRRMFWSWMSRPMTWIFRHWPFWKIIWIDLMESLSSYPMTVISWIVLWTAFFLSKEMEWFVSLKEDIQITWSAKNWKVRKAGMFLPVWKHRTLQVEKIIQNQMKMKIILQICRTHGNVERKSWSFPLKNSASLIQLMKKLKYWNKRLQI